MLTCKRCGYKWESRREGRPVSCPECKSRTWDVDRKKATPKVMELIDPRSGLMVCKVCGSQHWANIRPDSGGVYYRGSWQCVNRCRLPEKEPKAKRKGKAA